jgi:DNA polymerase-3 subunit epsilon
MTRGALAIAPSRTTYTPSLHLDEIDEQALIIDTETTGRSVTAEIIEVAICDIDGAILFESLVRPTERVPSSATRIHGLTADQLRDAPAWGDVWERIAPLITNRLLIAYNANFDRRMMEFMAARYRLPRPEARWRCAMRFVKEMARVRHALSLEAACARYGLAPGTHRAASDAQATAALLRFFKAALAAKPRSQP